MSDYHILTQDENKRSVNIVFHIPIPGAGTNEANVQWRNALILELGGSGNIVSVLPGISSAEDTQLKAGALCEVSKSIRFSSVNLDNAQRKTQIEAAFNSLKTKLVADKKITLQWIGYEGVVS